MKSPVRLFILLGAVAFAVTFVAVLPANAQVFIANYVANRIEVYTASGELLNNHLVQVGPSFPFYSVAVFGGYLYATRPRSNPTPGRVGKYTTSGQEINASLITLNDPRGIAVSSDGEYLFVVDNNGTIGKYTASGMIINASLISGLDFPSAIALSDDGQYLFVTTRSGVGKYSTSGATINASLITDLNAPLGIAISGTDLYVTTYAGDVVGKYTTSGGIINSRLITGVYEPIGIAVFGNRVFVVSYGSGTVGKYSTEGAIINASLITGLYYPSAISIASDPRITVQPEGQVRTESESATFTVAAAGGTPLSYQWFLNGRAIHDATASTLTINDITQAVDAGDYTVVVSDLSGSVASESAKLTVLSNLDGTVSPPEYGIMPATETGTDSLIVITHGLTPNLGDEQWIYSMRDMLRSRVPANWSVVSYAWTNLSSGNFHGLPDFVRVLGNARAEGQKLAADIYASGLQHPNGRWQHIHFIAHSAGAALIEEAAASLRDHIPTPEVHLTFLDPYVGLSYRSVYGRDADWADNYFAFDFQTIDEVAGVTDGPLAHSHNVDVTHLDPSLYTIPVWCSGVGGGPCRYQSYSTHGWPIIFYQTTITNPSFGSGYGYPLSKEAGGWNAHTSYQEGNSPPVVLGGSDTTVQGEINQTSQLQLDYETLPNATSQTGIIQTNISGFAATTGNATVTGDSQLKTGVTPRHKEGVSVASKTNGAPAWISVPVDTTTRINYVQFDLGFTGSSGGAGLVTVYWNDERIAFIDEQYAIAGLQHYLFALPDLFSDKNNCLGFRLDPFSGSPSSITVSNVAVGLVGLSSAPVLEMSSGSVGPSMTLTAIQGYTFLVETSSDLVSWSPAINVSLTDSSTAQFRDLKSPQFPSRFYRAVSP